jgi:hypothetical protein
MTHQLMISLYSSLQSDDKIIAFAKELCVLPNLTVEDAVTSVVSVCNELFPLFPHQAKVEVVNATLALNWNDNFHVKKAVIKALGDNFFVMPAESRPAIIRQFASMIHDNHVDHLMGTLLKKLATHLTAGEKRIIAKELLTFLINYKYSQYHTNILKSIVDYVDAFD